MPLGELDPAQPGGCFDTQIKTGAPALDEEGQGGGGLEAGILRERVVHSCTHVLIIDERSSPFGSQICYVGR